MPSDSALDLREQAASVQRVVNSLIERSAGTRGARLLGEGRDNIRHAFRTLDASVTRSVWNMQRYSSYAHVARTQALDDADRARGVDSRFIVPGSVLRETPMLLSLVPYLRVAPVFMPLIVLDGGPIIVSGPPSTTGGLTAWLVDDPVVCREAHRLWATTYAASTAGVDEPGLVVLTARQLAIFKHLAAGETDTAIARRLHISQRTLSNDLAGILDAAGARSRAQAVAVLNG